MWVPIALVATIVQVISLQHSSLVILHSTLFLSAAVACSERPATALLAPR